MGVQLKIIFYLILVVSVNLKSVRTSEDVKVTYPDGSIENVPQSNVCKYDVNLQNCTVPLNTKYFFVIEASNCACYVKTRSQEIHVDISNVAVDMDNSNLLKTCYVPLPKFTYNITGLLECHLAKPNFDTVNITLIYSTLTVKDQELFPFWIPIVVTVLILAPMLVLVYKYRTEIKEKLIAKLNKGNEKRKRVSSCYTCLKNTGDSDRTNDKDLTTSNCTTKYYFKNKNVVTPTNESDLVKKSMNNATMHYSKNNGVITKPKVDVSIIPNQIDIVNGSIVDKADQKNKSLVHGDDNSDDGDDEPNSDPMYVNASYYNNMEEVQCIYDLPKSVKCGLKNATLYYNKDGS